MNEETQPAGGRRRRTPAEVEQLVVKFESSGLNRAEFCRAHGLSLSTLNRYRRRGMAQSETGDGTRWVAVEMSRSGERRADNGGSGLAVVSTGGWRVEVKRGFHADTLTQLMRVLERI